MTTILKSSRFEATGGNLTRLHRAGALARPQRGLHRDDIGLTELRLEVMQESLGQILAPLEDLSLDLLSAVGLGDYATAHAARHAGARSDFADDRRAC